MSLTNFPNKKVYGLAHLLDKVATETTKFLNGDTENEEVITKGFLFSIYLFFLNLFYFFQLKF
jgi:hypothetical protein